LGALPLLGKFNSWEKWGNFKEERFFGPFNPKHVVNEKIPGENPNPRERFFPTPIRGAQQF